MHTPENDGHGWKGKRIEMVSSRASSNGGKLEKISARKVLSRSGNIQMIE